MTEPTSICPATAWAASDGRSRETVIINRVFRNFIGEVQKVIDGAKETERLTDLAEKLEKVLARLEGVTTHMGKTFMSADMKIALSFAAPFLEVMGDTIMAWMLLWRAFVAAPKLKKLVGAANAEERLEKINKNKNAAFYEGQIKSAEYFIGAVLPVTLGKINAIEGNNSAVVDIPEVSFAG